VGELRWDGRRHRLLRSGVFRERRRGANAPGGGEYTSAPRARLPCSDEVAGTRSHSAGKTCGRTPPARPRPVR
jgi:hypothetical protein